MQRPIFGSIYSHAICHFHCIFSSEHKIFTLHCVCCPCHQATHTSVQAQYRFMVWIVVVLHAYKLSCSIETLWLTYGRLWHEFSYHPPSTCVSLGYLYTFTHTHTPHTHIYSYTHVSMSLEWISYKCLIVKTVIWVFDLSFFFCCFFKLKFGLGLEQNFQKVLE